MSANPIHKLLFLTAIVLWFSSVAKAQASTQDSWTQDEWCENGLAYAEAEQFDRAMNAFEKAKALGPLSAENLIRYAIATVERSYTVYDVESVPEIVQDAVDAALPLENSRTKLVQHLYDDLLEFYSFNLLCEQGEIVSRTIMEFANRIENDSLLLKACLFKARFLECNHASSEDVEAYVAKATAIMIKNEKLKGIYYHQLGLSDYYFGRLAQTIERFLEAEKHLLQDQDSVELYELYSTYSIVYDDINDFERGYQILLKAEPYLDAMPLQESANYYNSLGWGLYRLNRPEEALETIRQSIRIYRLDSFNLNLAYPVGNLGLIFKSLGMLDSAEIYSKEAIDLFEHIHNEAGVAEACNNLGYIAVERGKNSQAEAYFLRSLRLITSDNEPEEYLKALEGLVTILEETDVRRAFSYLQEAAKVNEQLVRREEFMTIAQKEAEFTNRLNEEVIGRLESESQLKSLELEQKNYRLIFLGIGLLMTTLISVLIFLYWLQRRRMMKSLEDSNEINRRIISMISHDFRGPMNNVRSTLELLQSEELTQVEFLELTKELYRQSSSLSLMFDSFVGWAMTQRGGYSPMKDKFIWADVVREVIELSEPLANLKNLQIRVHQPDRVEVNSDRMACTLILRNILANAIKYSNANSSIEVSVEVQSRCVHTRIKDYGVGMSRERLSRVMMTGDGSRAGTNNEYGTGLGLRMVLKYIDKLGGKISVESTEGEGSTFDVQIPL